MRYAFFFLIGMMLAPMPILIWALNVRRGREDAEQYAHEGYGHVKDASEEEGLVGGAEVGVEEE